MSRSLVFAVLFSLALAADASAQSIFSTQGLGVPFAPVDARAQVLGGTLLGVLGLALATPFAAILQVLLRRVHREDILGEPAARVAVDYGEGEED
jgi:hypothetical protein